MEVKYSNISNVSSAWNTILCVTHSSTHTNGSDSYKDELVFVYFVCIKRFQKGHFSLPALKVCRLDNF